jgi:hypothetical protein
VANDVAAKIGKRCGRAAPLAVMMIGAERTSVQALSMKAVITSVVLTLIPVAGVPGESNVTRLHCEGEYTEFAATGARHVPIKGMYVEISGAWVKVSGALGFDSTYSVITVRDDGIGIQIDSNKNFNGFINRLSGELSLMEDADEANKRVRQFITATCRKATALF